MGIRTSLVQNCIEEFPWIIEGLQRKLIALVGRYEVFSFWLSELSKQMNDAFSMVNLAKAKKRGG